MCCLVKPLVSVTAICEQGNRFIYLLSLWLQDTGRVFFNGRDMQEWR